MSNVISNLRPEPDRLLAEIADYVSTYVIQSKEAYDTARYCLMDTLGCGLLALHYPACAKLLGPVVTEVTKLRLVCLRLFCSTAGFGCGKIIFHQSRKRAFFAMRERRMDIGSNRVFFTKIHQIGKACQTYGRLQIHTSFVVEWRLIFEMMQWDFN